MKTTFLATLLASAQLAMAEIKFASCTIEEKDGEQYGLQGTILFMQHNSQGEMKSLGVVSMEMDDDDWQPNNDDNDIESRYFGISENAPADTCMSMGQDWPLWFDADSTQTAMSPLAFHSDGYAINHQITNNASLFGDHSIIGNSLTVHDGMFYGANIDACCTIEEMVNSRGRPDHRAFRQAYRELRQESRQIIEIREDADVDSDSDSFDDESEDSESEDDEQLDSDSSDSEDDAEEDEASSVSSDSDSDDDSDSFSDDDSDSFSDDDSDSFSDDDSDSFSDDDSDSFSDDDSDSFSDDDSDSFSDDDSDERRLSSDNETSVESNQSADSDSVESAESAEESAESAIDQN